MGNVQAQNFIGPNGGFENKRIIDGKKFNVYYEEVVIDKTVDEVWAEVAGNFVNAAEMAASMKDSRGISGDLTMGLGAERFIDIDFQGKSLQVKERIIEFKEFQEHREFTYEAYETIGAPIKSETYNTWIVRKGHDGKTYLGTVFIFRANISFLTGIFGKLLIKSGSLRDGVLAYKHFLETGEKKLASKRLNDLYPRL